MPFFDSWLRSIRHARLRSTLVVPFVLEIITAVGLVGYLACWGAQKAVNDLAAQLRSEVSTRIEQELQHYFTTPHDINQLNAIAFAQRLLNFSNPQNLALIAQQVNRSSSINAAYCATQAGELLGVGRSSHANQLDLWLNNRATQKHFHYYGLDGQGNRLGLLQDDGPFDPRQRPWYKSTVQKQAVNWSDLYIDFTRKLPVITASLPVYSNSGQLLGVCATDVLLPDEFRRFLGGLQLGKTGQAFVIDRSGGMISSSTSEPLAAVQGEQITPVRAIDSENPLIRETARFLQQQFQNFQQIRQSQQFVFKADGQRQFVQVLPFQDGKGLDWLIVVTVPESEFMGQIYTTMSNTIWLALTALAVAIGLGVLTSRWITRSIHRITQAAEAMAQGDLNQRIEADSGAIELEKLASAFNVMAEQLRQSFSDLEANHADLRRSESRKQALLRAIPDLILEISADGIYLDCIPSKGGTWLVTDAESRIGKRVQDVLPGMLALDYLQTIQQVLQTEQASTLEYELMVDGLVETFEARVVPCSEQSALFIVRNITNRKIAEAALQQSEATNRALVEAIPDLLMRTRGDGTYIDITGRERLTIQNADRFLVEQHVRDSLPPDKAEQRMAAIQQALQTGKMQVYDQQFEVDGLIQYEEVRVIVSGKDEVLIMVRDITDRKRSEEALRIAEENYRSIFENALEGIFQSTVEGRFISVNPAMAQIYGYDSPDDMMANVTNIGEQIYVDPEARDLFHQQMAEAGQVKRLEYRVYRKEGEIIWIQEDTRSVRDNHGKLLYFEGIVQDITERKRKEEELRRQLEELKIEIDQKKRQQEVAMLTQDGFFQELQAEVSSLNLDEFWS